MIEYKLYIKNKRGHVQYIQSGEVTDMGNIVIELPKDCNEGSVEIYWGVQNGNNSNTKSGTN